MAYIEILWRNIFISIITALAFRSASGRISLCLQTDKSDLS